MTSSLITDRAARLDSLSIALPALMPGLIDDVDALRALVVQLLKPRQLRLLAYTAEHSGQSAVTRHIAALADLLECSQSSVWSGLVRLKQLALVDFGDAMSKGRPLRLTRLGTTLCGGMDNVRP